MADVTLELEQLGWRVPRPCSCGVAVVWALGAHGRPMPVEPAVVDDGDVRLELVDGELLAHVVAEAPAVAEGQLGLELDVEQVELGPRFRSHWARCPHADEHRRRP